MTKGPIYIFKCEVMLPNSFPHLLAVCQIICYGENSIYSIQVYLAIYYSARIDSTVLHMLFFYNIVYLIGASIFLLVTIVF